MNEIDPERIWTIGHSTHDATKFTELLRANAIEALADVRRFAASRRHPQFHADALSDTLAAAGIAYHALPELGGRRRAKPDTHNTAWRNASFRGYADYMETDAYGDGIGCLLSLAGVKRTAMMCAEAMWWQCHRGLIADDLKVRGIVVLHIGSGGAVEPHPFTSAARVIDGRLSYAGDVEGRDASGQRALF